MGTDTLEENRRIIIPLSEELMKDLVSISNKDTPSPKVLHTNFPIKDGKGELIDILFTEYNYSLERDDL